MAITFPREIPAVDYVTAAFVLRDGVKASPSGARLINYSQTTDPAWEATLVTKSLRASSYAEVEAWWLSLRDGLRRVLFRHPHFYYPKNHVTNQVPADDPGNLVSVASGNILTVNSVATALSLSIGDRIGLERAGRYHIGRVTEFSGTGTTRTITIDPPPFSVVAQATAVVRFAKPALVMRPVPGSWDVQHSNGRYTVSFKLVEGV
jgi:hypothetical protein